MSVTSSSVTYCSVCLTQENGQHADEYADLQIEVDGKLGCLAAFVSLRAQFPQLKIILSIGGGGEGSANFAAVAAGATSRVAFAKCAKEFVERFELNGIDSKPLKIWP